MANYDEIYKAQKKITDATKNANISSNNASIDAANARINESGEKSIETTKQSYEDVFRKNRLNQIINEEKTKERMTNLGLTDSGLNRSQQTAIQLQAANADAATVRNRQAAIDTIRSGIADAIAVNEAKRADYERQQNEYWDAQAGSNAASIYNEQVAAEAKAAEANREALNQLITNLSNTELTHEQRLAYYKAYSTTNGFDNEEQANKIAETFGLGTVKNGELSEETVVHGSTLPVTIKNFNPTTNRKDNFFITVDGTRYRLENQRQLDESKDSELIANLGKIKTNENSKDNIIKLGDTLYLKRATYTNGIAESYTYYELGPTTFMGIERGHEDKIKSILDNLNQAK